MITLLTVIGSIDLGIILLLCSHKARQVVRRLIKPRLNSTMRWQCPVHVPVKRIDADMLAYLASYHTGCRFTAEHTAAVYFK